MQTTLTNLAPILDSLREAGVTSLKAIAAELNAREIPTLTGSGPWQSGHVSRALVTIMIARARAKRGKPAA